MNNKFKNFNRGGVAPSKRPYVMAGLKRTAVALTAAAMLAGVPAVALAADGPENQELDTARQDAGDAQGTVYTVSQGNDGNLVYTQGVNAVEDVPAYKSGDILELSGEITKNITISTAGVTVRSAANSNAVMKGTLRISANNVKVQGLQFELDPATSTNAQSLIVGDAAQNVIIGGEGVDANTFTIKNGDPSTGASENKDWQPSSVWLEGGADGTEIKGNTFKLGQVVNNSAVGVNLVGSAGTGVIDGTVISGNTVYAGPTTGTGASGSMMFVVGNGNTREGYGITGLHVSGNKVYNNTGADASKSRVYGVAVTATKGTKIDGGNEFEGLQSVSYSNYPNQGPNTGMVVEGNNFDTYYGFVMGDYVEDGGLTQSGNTFKGDRSLWFNGGSVSYSTPDGTVYGSVDAALNAGKTQLKLLHNASSGIKVETGTTLDLDLNGYDVTAAQGGEALNAVGTLTVRDSAGTGTVKGTVSKGENGSLTILGGTYQNPGTNISDYVPSGYEYDSATGKVTKVETSGGSVTPSASVSAKSFSYDVSKGELTADEIIELSGAKAENAGTDPELTVDADQLAVLNDAISRGLNGGYTMTVSVKGKSAKAEVKVTLTGSKSYADVPSSQWYRDVVYKATSLGYMTGKSGTAFDPDGTLTRAEAVETLYKMAGASTVYGKAGSYETGFTDTGDDQWYAESLSWGRACGVVSGYPDGSFRPDAPVTREEFAKMLMNYASKAGKDTSSRGDVSGYADAASLGWSRDAVSWAVFNKVMGQGTDTLAPAAPITRAQTAAMAVRYQPDGRLTAKLAE